MRGQIGSEVEIGEKYVVRLEQRHFGWLGFFDFNDQFRIREHAGRIRDDACANSLIVLIIVAGSVSCTSLDEHLVAPFDEFRDRAGDHADAVFLRFDFFGDSDFHEFYFGKLLCGGIGTIRNWQLFG